MSLNKIELTAPLLAGLYSHSLITVNTTSVPEKIPAPYLGNNQKQILLIVSYDKVRYLPDGALNFLTSIISACKLSLDDIGILNKEQIPADLLQAILHKESKKLLLFGIDPLSIGLPINFPQFQLQQFNGRTYLYAPSLQELENDKTLKQKLWSALKGLFGI